MGKAAYKPLPESKHFKLERLNEGVYVAIASEQGYAICNAGIIDIGDRTIIFDTFISPKAARDLRKSSEQLTTSRITHVINSHYHNDHIRGNQVFDNDVDIISTTLTREAIIINEPEEIKSEKETLPKAIIDAESKLIIENEPKRLRELAFLIVYLEAMSKSHSELKTRLPNITFTKKLIIHGNSRTVELLPYSGHTASDVVLYLPEEKIAFMGDLLFIESHPYLVGGYPEQWKESLREIVALGVQTLVPGHGPVGRSTDLSLMSQYIESLENIARNMLNDNITIEQISRENIPPPFNTWMSPVDSFFASNLRFLYKLVEQKKVV